ncbi:GAF domain-containing protein [Halorarius halobius]|uniref:GAF domain-containing protein n=1 Tax=Halorarius halobius TaxID=2962671 RepID=UPI0020CED294|nr:GAF domain-containing protein [Halorarius halobius]
MPDPTHDTAVPEQLLHVTADRTFAEALVEALDRPARRVETLVDPDRVRSRLDATRHDAIVVDHDGVGVDAPAVVRAATAAQPATPVVVCAVDAPGEVASEVLEAGATTFVSRDADGRASAVAGRVDDVLEETPGDAREGPPPAVVEDVLSANGVGVVLSDDTGTVQFVTDGVAELFDVPADRAVGSGRRRLVRERLAPAVEDPTRLTGRLLDASDGERLLIRSTHTDGGRWIDCRSQSLGSGPFAGGRVDRFTDVTRFVREEAPLQELQRLVLAREMPFAERLHEVLELGADRLELPYGFVTAIDDGVQSVLDSVGDHELLQPGESAPLLRTYCRKTLAADGVVGIPDAVADGWTADPAYETFGLDAYVGAPVTVGDEPYGTLCFAGSSPHDGFTDEQELFVEFAAAWTGWELDRYEPS